MYLHLFQCCLSAAHIQIQIIELVVTAVSALSSEVQGTHTQVFLVGWFRIFLSKPPDSHFPFFQSLKVYFLYENYSVEFTILQEHIKLHW